MLVLVSERMDKTPEAAAPDERDHEGESAVNKPMQRTRAKVAEATRPKRLPEISDEEEQIIREATKHLILKHGMFLVATGVREECMGGCQQWIITVTLRYPTGHEGYIGDLRYDAKEFTFLTEQSVMDERARKIAEDPERIRKWNEYRASTLQAGEG